MPTKHHISEADELFAGKGYFPPIAAQNERKGVPIDLIMKLDLGAPVVADINSIIAAATSAELPNAATITYTTADDAVSPIDDGARLAVATITTSAGDSVSVWVLDVPRTLSLNVTHGSAIVAMSCTVTGYDAWGQKVVETMSVTATGTTKTSAGLKAMKYVESVAFTAAGDATANTANLGSGSALGLPYKLAHASDLMSFYADGTMELATATVAAAVTTTATATTGDVRGTIVPNTTMDGTVNFYAWMSVADRNSANGLKGVDQYAG
jgi:hypothetical protein